MRLASRGVHQFSRARHYSEEKMLWDLKVPREGNKPNNRYDWRPLKKEVFEKKAEKVEEKLSHSQERQSGRTFIPEKEEDEFLGDSITKFDQMPAVEENEEATKLASLEKMKDSWPTPRKQKLNPDGSAFGKGGRKRAKAYVTIKEKESAEQKSIFHTYDYEDYSNNKPLLEKRPSGNTHKYNLVNTRNTTDVRINGKDLATYFPHLNCRQLVLEPLVATETVGEFFVDVTVVGGGDSGQAEAVRHGLGNAIQNFNPDYRWALKQAGCLRRDPRKKERKKLGQPKARRKKQFSKR